MDMPSTVSQYLVLGKNRLTIADFFFVNSTFLAFFPIIFKMD